MKLLKKHILSLEKVFQAEIEGLSVQSKTKTFYELEKNGFVEIGERVYGARSRFPVIVKGFYLTHKGRIAYCEWASKHCPPEP